MQLASIISIILINGILQGNILEHKGSPFYVKNGNHIVFVKRIFGALLLGGCLIINKHGIDPPAVYRISQYAELLIGATLLISTYLVLNYSIKRHTDIAQKFPLLKYSEWQPAHHLTNILTQSAYLAVYELATRACLINTLNSTAGLSSAIIIAALINVVSHYPKGKFECLGSLPFSLIQSFLWIAFGSIIPLIVFHIVFNLAFEYNSIILNLKKRVP